MANVTLSVSVFLALLRLAWVDNRAAEGGWMKLPGIIITIFNAAFCLGLGVCP